jgi:hypothetical protein
MADNYQVVRQLENLTDNRVKHMSMDFGCLGHAFVTDDSQAGAEFYYIESRDDTTVIDYTVLVYGKPVSYTGITLKDAHYIVGLITNLEVTAGQVIAYYR